MTTWVLYYRPQRIDELNCIQARTSLEKILASGKVPKALLFTGPRGIGKTSAARIVAKVLNCEKAENKIDEPCNQCDQCRAITVGTSLDVLEIDGASNRGIDDIRELRERVRLAPSSARNRVYIVDEVHMLTTEAFNALLKTLEEPPAHTYFILCTTDPQKVPETIISRCTRVVFKSATAQETLEKLKLVVRAENLTVEKKALDLLAKESRGSFRDAVKLLEQAAGDKKVTLSEVKELLGQLESADPLRLLTFLSSDDSLRSLEEIGRVAVSGTNLKNYIENMVEILRDLLIEKIGVEEENNWRFRYQEVQTLTAMPTNEIDQLIRILSRAYSELRDAVIPQLPLELAAIEWCSTKHDTAEEVKSSPSKDDFQKSDSADEKGKVAAEPVDKTRLDSHSADIRSDTAVSLATVSDHWQEVLLKIRPKNHSVEALLKACRPLSIQDSFLEIEVFYKFHKDRLETEKYRLLVEESLQEITGLPLRIKYHLGEKPTITNKEPDTTISKTSDDVSGKAVDEEIVKAATEIFKGTIVE